MQKLVKTASKENDLNNVKIIFKKPSGMKTIATSQQSIIPKRPSQLLGLGLPERF